MSNPRDEVLALLCGALGNPPTKEAQLAGTFLGSSLGAFVDMGRTDQQILALCQSLLQQIRSALKDPAAMADFNKGLEAIRTAHGSDK